ncbi:MAG: c-type cytochrome [Gemmatimonadetes bacterium]|nr:c-type cytochrome [Gemmatimonadota bacterium]
MNRKLARLGRTTLLLAFPLVALGFATRPPGRSELPRDPRQAQGMFEIEKGFAVELFASEPQIVDPVAMEIDEQGRIYVAELRAYPDRKERISTIKLLEDTTGDGRPDRSTVFADDLWWPKGILRWKRGLIVPDGTDLLYLEDSDADGKADVRRVLLTGFDVSNPQSGINSPLYGLDNWIYLGHNSPGTVLKRPGQEGVAVPNVSRRNFRFNPETGEVQPLASATQFGHTFDAWGRHLLVSNANHLFQEVVGARYLARNPELLVSSTTEILPVHGAAAEIFPIAVNPGYQLFTDVGVVTSASGLTTYLGGAFGPEYQGATFVGDPSHNLVHVDRLEDRGATFRAHRLQHGREFLASRDGRFRPVNFYVGPDGAMYVIDYYRGIVEQPRYLSSEVMQSGALYDGAGQGRIWRIVPAGGLPVKRPGELRLGYASSGELVRQLEQTNVWYRRTAQRLLVDRKDAAAVAPLEQMVRQGALPEARLHALWALEGMGRLGAETIRAALEDPAEGVRENAVRVAEIHLASSPGLVDALVAMAPTARGKVAFQLLLTLGEVDTPAIVAARERLLLGSVEEEWMQIAGLTARGLDVRTLFERAQSELSAQATPARTIFFRRLGVLMASRRDQVPGVVGRLLGVGADAGGGWWRGAVLSGIADRADSTAFPAAELPVLRTLLLDAFLSSEDDAIRSAALSLLAGVNLPAGAQRDAAMERVASLARDASRSASARADAVGFLARYDASRHAALFANLVSADTPIPVQAAAVRAMRQVGGAAPGRAILDRWPTLPEPVRNEAVNVLLADSAMVPLLVDALEQRRVQPSAIGWIRSKRLMMSPDTALRERSLAIFSPEKAAGDEVVRRYSTVVDLSGDAARGEQVFARTCAMCHQVGGQKGIAFGPDLATIRSRRTEFLLSDILLPSHEIAAGYEQWVVELRGGDQVAGLIRQETPTSVTIRSIGGAERTLARSEIARMEAVNASPMPEGLGQQIEVPEMADLIAFLRRPTTAAPAR